MYKLLLGFALILTMPLTTVAAENAHPWKGHAGATEWFTKNLELTAEQQAKVAAVLEQQMQKTKLLHDESRDQIQQILTAEQRTKMDALRKEHKEKYANKKDKAGSE